MAEKRYYWLKLKEDYFTNPKIKKLRKIAGGDTFTIIYLKMQLLSISNQGIIEFEEIENTFEEELSLKLDEDLENVQLTLAYLKAQGLVETNKNEYLLVDACNNIGSECDSAKRVREFREKKNKVLQCNSGVTPVLQNSISISNSSSIYNIKEEKEVKHKYGEYKNVLLKDSELIKLKQDHPNWEELIKYLDEYIEMKGAKYKSHYLAIKKWVVVAVRQHKLNTNNNGREATKREYTKEELNNLFDNIEDINI
jgi:predicted phage replisome organizer